MTRAHTYLLLCGSVATLVVSCGATAQPASQAPSQPAAGSVVGAIATARNAQCTTIGPQVARYLAAGDNGGHPELDDGFAQDRTYILSTPADARDGLIRVDANDATAKCDAKVDADAAAQARAAQEQAYMAAQTQAAATAAAEQAQAATARAAALAKEKDQCVKLGGKWDGSACPIDYWSPGDGQLYHYTVSFDSAGNVTPGVVRDAAQCATYYGPGLAGRWHTDTDVCSD